MEAMGIVLSGKVGGTTIIDAEDWPKVRIYNWSNCKGYARAIVNGKTTGMHQLIMGSVKGQFVHHLNNNPLDNRKCNLLILDKHTHHRALHRKQNKCVAITQTDIDRINNLAHSTLASTK